MKLIQVNMGEKLGITFQQFPKYENGSNRIFAGRLCQIAQILNVTPDYFYYGLTSSGTHTNSDLLHNFNQIESDDLKQHTQDLIYLVVQNKPALG